MSIKKIIFRLSLLVIILLPVLLNITPILYSYFNPPNNMFFTGNNSWLDPWDVNVYVSIIKYGQTRGFLLENFYTSLPHPAAIFYPLYTLAGMVFKNVNPYLLFHFLSVFFGVLFTALLWLIARRLFNKNNYALISVFLISIGGGLGWMVINRLSAPDLTMTGFTLISVFQRAHESLGLLLYVLSLYLVTKNLKNFALAILLIAVLFIQIFIYPYLIASFFLISFLYYFFTVERKLLFEVSKPLFASFAVIFPVLFFYIIKLYQSPGFNLIYEVKLGHPDNIGMVIGYGFLLPLFLIQLRNPQKNNYWYLFNVWVVVSVVLSYLPFGFARFYLKTLYIPINFCVLIGIKYITKKIKLSLFTTLALLLIFIPVNSIYIFYNRVISSNSNNDWIYKKNDEFKALVFLQNYGKPGEAVLSYYKFGNIIPAYTDKRVYFGHWLQTPGSSEKSQNIGKFYRNKLNAKEAKEFLRKNQIKYVYLGIEEAALGNDGTNAAFVPYNFLRLIFKENDIVIYKYE